MPDPSEDKADDEQADEEKERELTPEEQMAKFEEEMKNEDWGHQPC